LNKHRLQILTFENNRNIIKTNTRLTAKKASIFPNGENSENIKASKKCFSKEIQRHFAANFNLDLLKNRGLSKGKKRVFVQFKIDNNGDIKKVKVKSPHPEITLEVTKVMYTLPKIVPGKINGKNVGLTFNIPFILNLI
jgi:bla regulator protein BlaR1